MKALDAEKEGHKASMVKKEAKRRHMKALMGEAPVTGDDSSTNSFNLDFEKQLRKLATKGVVALFNAVAANKRGALAKDSKDKPKSIDDDDHSVGSIGEHSLGSLKDLQGVHKPTNKRPAEAPAKTAAAPAAPAAKKVKGSGWAVTSSAPIGKAALSAGWDQDEDDD